MSTHETAMAELFDTQAQLCARLGGELYAGLLPRCAKDIATGGPLWTVLRGIAGCPEDAYPALRLLGSVHRLVLSGRAPALAAHYPSVGGSPGPDLWPAFRSVVIDHADTLAGLVRNPPQTNEVGRAASLLGGFLTVARDTGLPLRLLEVGASAGLNLSWDRYRYESAGWAWCAPDAALRLTDIYAGSAPAGLAGHPVTVTERLGCDLNPVDLSTEDGPLTLLAYVWPDQIHRIARLRSAIETARDTAARIDRADALDWLRTRLADIRPGVATIVFHSIVLTYFDDTARRAFDRLLTDAGRRATAHTPLAWLSLERHDDEFEVRLRTWPGDHERLLARCGGHGLPVHWLA